MIYSIGFTPATVTSEYVMTGAGLQLSIAVAVPVLAGKVLPVHATVIFAGQVMTGGVLSSIVMSWLHVIKLPQASCDFHVLVMVYS